MTRPGHASFLFGLAGLALGVAAPAMAQERDSVTVERVRPADGDIARAIRDKARGEVKDFYQERAFRPLWVTGGELNEAAFRFLDMIDSAQVDGLDPDDYAADDLRKLIERTANKNPKALAEAELKLSREFARLVQDMRRPRIEIHYADEDVQPAAMREDDVLRRAGAAKSFPEYVANMGWMHPLYAGLRQQLIAADMQAGRPAVDIPGGRAMRQGDSGDRVSLLRQRLGLHAGEHFDEELARAVRSFQTTQGMAPDGVAGPQTLAALNGAVGARPADVEQVLRVNLERARLLPDASTKHVVVNAAAAHLTYYEEGEERGAMKVVVGTPETPTPMMAGMIRYATLNPYWNLPVDLVASIIAPRVLAGNSLKRMGYEVLSDWSVDAEVIDPATVDWRGVAAGKVEARVRQLPGAGNSMGDVKYMFPNDLGIFLHDTPNRALFNRQARQFSNGCVRLEDAGRLGEWLFGAELEAESDEPEQHRPLPRAVPVYLTYLTAVSAGPSMAYFPDVYSLDGKATTQLASK